MLSSAYLRNLVSVSSCSRHFLMNRRPALWLVFLLLTGLEGAAVAQTCTSNPIVCENSLAGTSGWQISGIGDSTIQGFTTDISVNVGQTIYFKVQTPASSYHIDIYRLGYYGGVGARKVATINPSVTLPQSQPACLTDSSTNLMDCGNWAISASWAVPSTAVSGYYFGRLVRNDTGGASQAFFIVRNDSSHSDILFQASDETWQAYNPYGGHSLYGDSGWNLPSRAYKVSYNRPFNTAALETWTWVYNAEYPMIRWMESNGYDISYFTGVDAVRNASLITNHKAYISVGHDEYWSGPQRTNVEAARDAGVHMAFFSGNEVFWKTRWENSIDGTNTPYRTLVCYKETLDSTSGGPKDPLDPPTWTGTWRDPSSSPPADGGRPENNLTGTIFMVNGPGTDNNLLSIVVPAADGKMRFWRNTAIANLSSGQSITLPAGTLGYEWDSDLDNGARRAGLFHLSTATYNLTTDLLLDYGAVYGAGTATHNMTMYRAPSGALVFGAGTVQWAWGLDSNHDNGSTAPDIRMQQATVNLFADMGVQPQTIQSGLVATQQSTDHTAPVSTITSPASGANVAYGTTVTVTGTAADSGGGVVGGVEVSVDGGQTWHPATGRESWTYSWATAIPNTGHLMSRAVDDSGNIETPSAGVTVTVPRPVSSITLDVTSSADSSSASKTIQTPAFSTTSSNELLLAFVGADATASGNTVTGVTGGGLTWTLVQRTNAQMGTSEIWRAFATAPLSNVQVTATLAQSVFSSITVQAYTGVDTSGTNGSGAIGAVASGSAGSGAPSAHLVTTRNASLVVGVGNDYDNAIARVPQAGQTLVHQDLAASGDTYWVQAMSAPTALSGTTVTIADTAPTGDRYNLAICEILATTVTGSTVSGTISPNTIGAGSLVTLSGTSSASTTADASGNFSFSSLISGPYTVTPSKSGVLFSPPNQALTVNGANVSGVNFIATTAPTYSISGTITPAASASGASVAIIPVGESGGAIAPVTVNASGTFTATGLPNGTYTIAPTKSGFTFTPASSTAVVSGANVSGVSFTIATSTTPPVISSVTAAPATTSAVITWSTDSATTSVVNYGTSAGALTLNASNSTLVTSHSITLTGLTANATYYYTVTSVDGSNNTATSPVATFTTLAAVPPVISGLTVVPGANGSATVYWSTNVATSATVNYGTSAGSLTLSVNNPTLATTHALVLTGLTTGTVYYYTVTSADTNGTPATSPSSGTASFIENPLLSVWNPSATPVTVDDPDTESTELGVKFRSDVAGYVTGVRFYKGPTNTGTHVGNLWDSAGNDLATVTFSSETASGWQEADFATPIAIAANTTYIVSYFAPSGHYADDANAFATAGVDNAPLHALANGVDGANGVYAYGTTSTFPSQTYSSSNYWVDLVFSTPNSLGVLPTISGVTVTPSTTSATITWTTNVAASSVVNYGTSAGALSLNASNASLVTSHSITLTGLTAGVTYYYTVTSVDGLNNTVTSPAPPNAPATFTTPLPQPPVISAVTAVPGQNGAATITWTTNTASTSRVDYGTSSGSLTLNASTASLVTAHTITLSGLTQGVTYYYRVTSVDGSGNSATSPATTGSPASFVETAAATYSIWTTSNTPATIDSADPGAVELGMKFRSDVAGYVTGLRFYKAAANTGVHIGNLWTTTGTQLATVTFSGETASGWQQASFSTPVLIAAGTTYIISYYAPAGHYSVTEPYFDGTNGDNPPLHALSNSAGGGNGVYQYGSTSAFPAQTYDSSNYWVDVLFSASTVSAFPSAVVIQTGTLSAGTAASLGADDNTYYQVNSTTSGTRTSSWYGSFTSVPSTLSNLMVTYKGKNSRSCTQVVSIWNWSTSAWVQLVSAAVSTTEVLQGPLSPTGTLANYVSGAGELRVQVKCSTTSGNFTASGDLMNIEYNN